MRNQNQDKNKIQSMVIEDTNTENNNKVLKS
jgi:hypothetical protein